MSITRNKAVGLLLIGAGICIAVFSPKIVFPGLESALGIETIVGKQNVVYLPDGGYGYTNPGAMVRWISTVAGVGVFLVGIGSVVLLRSRHTHVT
jgi:hypothetical protein